MAYNFLNIENPLARNGSGQEDRYPAALDPASVKLDGRTLPDLIRFTYEYARMIRCYNLSNQPEGDWRPFWELEATFLLGVWAALDIREIEKAYRELEIKYWQQLEDYQDGRAEADESPYILKELIDQIYQLAAAIQEACERMPAELELKAVILDEIKNRLREPLRQLIEYDKGNITNQSNDYTAFLSDFVAEPSICRQAWGLDQHEFYCLLPVEPQDAESLAEIFLPFFTAIQKIRDHAQQWFHHYLHNNDGHRPYVALFFTFLELFKHPQAQLNDLARKHLDYFYQEVLRLPRKAERPDSVHLIFDIAENLPWHLIREGTLVSAGKDAEGQEMVYALADNLAANHAKVEELRSLYIDESGSVAFRAAPVANSCDGKGAPFPEGVSKGWRGLGSKETLETEIGFAVASTHLYLEQGERQIRLIIPFSDKAADPSFFTELLNDADNKDKHFRVELSTEKEWLPLEFNVEASEGKRGFTYDIPGLLEGEIKLEFTLQLFPGDPPIAPFKGETKTGVPILTDLPCVKIFITNYTWQHAADYKSLIKAMAVKNIELRVKVKGLKNLLLRNDNGDIDVNAKIYPFTQVPNEGAQFTIGSGEVFSKELKSLDLNIKWDGLEGMNFGKYYRVYNFYRHDKIGFDSFKFRTEYLKEGVWKNLSLPPEQGDSLFSSSDIDDWQEHPVDLEEILVPDSIRFLSQDAWKLIVESLSANEPQQGLDAKQVMEPWGIYLGERPVDDIDYTDYVNEVLDPLNFFHIPDPSMARAFFYQIRKTESESILKIVKKNDGIVSAEISSIPEVTIKPGVIQNGKIVKPTEVAPYSEQFTTQGFIRLVLGRDFLHEAYGKVLAQQLMVQSEDPDSDHPIALPEPPFTPVIDSISVDYEAATTLNPGETPSEFFQLTPMSGNRPVPFREGESLTPLFLQKAAGASTLYPAHGNLFIGLRDLTPGQIVSILFQVEEASGDPDAEVPEVHWDYLADNEWKPFPVPFIVSDETLGLRRSGIIQFRTPLEMVAGNTILNPELYWIRASATETYGAAVAALPNLIDVRAQAVRAVFLNRGNSLEHLQKGLPAGTISQLVRRDVAVTAIEQPFASFDGIPPESGRSFYQRVSERLRHRDRAITVYDYERLVLQHFPDIYHAKCLNHTDLPINLAPGYVTLAVIPNLKHKSGGDPYQPRVDVGTRKEIELFLNRHNTPMVAGLTEEDDTLEVVNPVYEPIKVCCCVQFRPGYEPNLFKFRLNEELKQFLAPWTFDSSAEIAFGKEIFRFSILNFIEERDYVDIVTDFELIHYVKTENGTEGQKVTYEKGEAAILRPQTARSILTTYINPETLTDPNQIDHHIRIIEFIETDTGLCPSC